MFFRLSLLILLLLFACAKKSDPPTPDPGYDYFPLVPGTEKIFKVDSVSFTNNSGYTVTDTLHYFYKEKVGNSFIDATGKEAFEIYRYYTDSLQHPWNSANSYIASTNQFRSESVEENIRKVKLVFPLTPVNSWNGYMYSNVDPFMFSIKEYELPFGTNGLEFSKTILVEEQNRINAIEEIYSSERYAKGFGMIFSEHDSVNTQSNGSNGYKVRMSIINKP